MMFGIAAPGPLPAQPLPPPVAKTIPKTFKEHGRTRVDLYDWLRNSDDPHVLTYLKAENDYASSQLARIQPLIAEIETELEQRADGASQSPEFTKGGYIYKVRIAQGARFPSIVRRRNTLDAPEQTVLDIEGMAAGHAQYLLGDYVVSPNDRLVAFTVDFSGGRSHRVFIRDLVSGKITDTGIRNAAPELAFSADSQSLFYVRVEPETIRSYQLRRRDLKISRSGDIVLYEERDQAFELELKTSRSGRYIILTSVHQTTTEVRYLPLQRADGRLRLVEPRRLGVVYEADHIGDTFYIRTNLNAPDFRIISVPEAAPQRRNWRTVVAETPGRHIVGFLLFESFIALAQERDANRTVRVLRGADLSEIDVPRPAEIGTMDLDFAQGLANLDPSATVLQIRFSGLLHPNARFDFDTATGKLSLRQRSRPARWFDPSAYEAKRITARSADGELVPVTLMYRKGMLRPGGNPTLVTGYGAYGSSMIPEFDGEWVSLVDRGFIYAIAHVRGGLEKGIRWHDDGRMLHKGNSFADFIAAAEGLTEQGFANREKLFAHGASAGGLLVAAVANRRPDLFAGVIAEVPFVDVITSMSDPSLPLTTLEYEEWGDPSLLDEYEMMLSYSPYDNVAAKAYPAMFVTGAFRDSQVRYHEPAKWVARIRAAKTNASELLFMTDMDAGHSGTGGRFGSTRKTAQLMAWLISHSH
jgi:oligopeptidase B